MPVGEPGACPLSSHAAGDNLPARQPTGLHDPPPLECERPIAPESAQYSRPILRGSVCPDALAPLRSTLLLVDSLALSSPGRALRTSAPASHIHARATP